MRRTAIVLGAATAVLMVCAGVTVLVHRPPPVGRTGTTPAGHTARAAAGLVRCGEHITASHTGLEPVFVASGTTSVSTDPDFERQLCRAERELAAVRLPPGATPSRAAPAGLGRPAQYPEDGNLIDRARFWTVPGPWLDTLAWFRAHPPRGTTGVTGSGGSTGSGRSLMFGGLTVTVRPIGSGGGVRVDAQEIWVPSRTAADRIGRVSSVRVTLHRWDSPAITRDLGAAGAQRLAAAIDALQPTTPGVRNCPADRGSSDTLVFATAQGAVTAVDHADGCPSVTLHRDGRAELVLDGSVDDLTRRLLHLPAAR